MFQVHESKFEHLIDKSWQKTESGLYIPKSFPQQFLTPKNKWVKCLN